MWGFRWQFSGIHLGERPAYRIFECGSCEALTWIAITGSEPHA
jgi:hypothetical protein